MFQKHKFIHVILIICLCRNKISKKQGDDKIRGGGSGVDTIIIKYF